MRYSSGYIKRYVLNQIERRWKLLTLYNSALRCEICEMLETQQSKVLMTFGSNIEFAQIFTNLNLKKITFTIPSNKF